MVKVTADPELIPGTLGMHQEYILVWLSKLEQAEHRHGETGVRQKKVLFYL